MQAIIGHSILCAYWRVEFAADLPQKHFGYDRFARGLVAHFNSQLGRRRLEIDALDGEGLAFTRGDVITHQRRSAFVVLRMSQPAAIGADRRPVFIRLAKRDFLRVLQWRVEWDVPEVSMRGAAV